MRLPFRTVLPVSLTCLSLALMLWDVHNQHACVLCDTGLPVWPYQASSLILRSLNAPAFVMAAPFFRLPHLQSDTARYPMLLAVIYLWWWWLGTRFDFGLLGSRHYRFPKLHAVALAVVTAALLYLGGRIVGDEVHHWLTYGPSHPLQLATTIVVILWALALSSGCLFAAIRLLQKRFPLVTESRRQRPVLRYGCSFIALIALTTSFIGYAREPRVDPDTCVASNGTGCVHGTVTDQAGKALKGIQVEVLPAEKTGEHRWYATKSEWTDAKGRYSLNEIEPGEYLIGVHYYDAPDARRPYPTTFYPGLEVEASATRVLVVANAPTLLNQFRLRPLTLANIKVEVVWPDGTKPKWSNLLFHNRSYPSQAVIGNEAPQVDDGIGDFTLPEGFVYSAQAAVRCDAGKIIETRESQPAQTVDVSAGITPQKLTFTIPGPPCVLWRSR
jgi:hypothetical protein